jgi:hypothetical protein
VREVTSCLRDVLAGQAGTAVTTGANLRHDLHVELLVMG